MGFYQIYSFLDADDHLLLFIEQGVQRAYDVRWLLGFARHCVDNQLLDREERVRGVNLRRLKVLLHLLKSSLSILAEQVTRVGLCQRGKHREILVSRI